MTEYGRDYLNTLTLHEVKELQWQAEGMLQAQWRRARNWGGLTLGIWAASAGLAFCPGPGPYLAIALAVVGGIVGTEALRVWPEIRYWRGSLGLYRQHIAEAEQSKYGST